MGISGKVGNAGKDGNSTDMRGSTCRLWSGEWLVRGRRARNRAGMLHQFDQNAAGVLGVGEINEGPSGTDLGFVVKQAHADRSQVLARGLDIGDRVRHLLYAGSTSLKETANRGVWRERSKELDPGSGIAHGEHRLANALLLIDLLVGHRQAKRADVEVDGVFEIANRDPNVIDTGNPGMHAGYGVTR
jgi:hypothetical protein